ncbi:MAG: flippase-like domain-containing protein [Bacteroidales bacterium]|nr:flippase-like domain-containing protein [Bacteroidales bacterium]
MNKKILNILKVIGFIFIGAVLFWLVYKNQDFETIKQAVLKAKFEWLLLSMVLGLLSHYSRAARWKLLLKPLGYDVRKKTLFFSVMIMYLTNHAIPRSGEIVRCGVVNRYEKVPFSTLLGTVFTERVIDVIVLFILTVIVAATQFHVLIDFLNNNQAAQENLDKISNSLGIILAAFVIFVSMLILMFVFRKKIKQLGIYKKFQKLIEDFLEGLKSVLKLEKKWLFIAHTIFIWGMYFVMIYVVFFAFDFTSHLSVMAGLTIFVLSSFGIVIPSPGGIGTWHFIAIETLFVYGIEKDNGRAFAFAAHESQMIMLIVVGILSLLSTSLIKAKESKKIAEQQTEI